MEPSYRLDILIHTECIDTVIMALFGLEVDNLFSPSRRNDILRTRSIGRPRGQCLLPPYLERCVPRLDLRLCQRGGQGNCANLQRAQSVGLTVHIWATCRRDFLVNAVVLQ